MMFLTVILAIFITLILISIVNTLLFIALKLVTKEHYKEHYLILPSLISLVLWSIIYIIAIKIISSVTGISLFDSISASLFNISSFTKFLPNLVLPIIVLLAIALLLQSIVLLLVNIDYSIPFNKFRYFLKRKFMPNENRDEYSDIISAKLVTDIKQVEQKYKLNFVNSFVCSLFIFSLLFFINILFFWIGTLIGNTILGGK